MNLLTIISLLFDGAEVLVENIKIVLVLSANIIGIGVLVLEGISASRVNSEWSKNGVALLSFGICGFVVISYVLVAISRIWHLALPILSNSLLIISLLAFIVRLLLFIKKKSSPVDSAASSPRCP